MSHLAICRFPNPVLKQPTEPIRDIDASVKQLSASMIRMMRTQRRCVGLAAPQVGLSLKLAVMDASVHPSSGKNHGELVLINPVIHTAEGAGVQREGCLSIPDFTANVKRAERVLLRAVDISGNPYELWLEGFEAIVAQHEVDHLDGMLFLDRVANLKTDVFRRKTYL
jgi:peptide deformylase